MELRKLFKLFMSIKYEPGMVLTARDLSKYMAGNTQLVVLSVPPKGTPKNVNAYHVAGYPIKDLDYSGLYSHTSIKENYEITGFDKTVMILYGKNYKYKVKQNK